MEDERDAAGGRSRERLSDARWQAVLGIVLVAIGATAGFWRGQADRAPAGGSGEHAVRAPGCHR